MLSDAEPISGLCPTHAESENFGHKLLRPILELHISPEGEFIDETNDNVYRSQLEMPKNLGGCLTTSPLLAFFQHLH